MATNHIDGDLVGIFISTNLTTPAYKEVVCGENIGLDGSADVTTKKTKCGTIKTTGPASWTISGTGTHNTAPGTDQISADDLIDLLQSGDSVLVKVVHATDDDLLYRQGQGVLSKYTEKSNTGSPSEFDFTIDISGVLDIIP